MGLGHPYSEQWHHPCILIRLRQWQMQCFTDPELEAGEIPVRDPFGNPVPASLEHSKVRREAKKAKKKFQKQLSIDRSREAQAQLEADGFVRQVFRIS